MVKLDYYDSYQKKMLVRYFTSTKIAVSIAPPPTAGIDPTILAKISSMGFVSDGVTEYNDYYLVEGDIRLLKSTLHNPAGTIYTINNNHGQNINIEIDASVSANSPWYQGLHTALLVWNSVPGSNIKINLIIKEETYFTAPRVDVTIRGDNGVLSGNIATNAVYPIGNGEPGKSILINSDFNLGNLTQSQATWNLIHAIGHVLGLKHSATNGSIMYRNSFQTNYLGQDYLLPTIEDVNQVTALYPLSSSDVPQPFIHGSNVVFNLSYASKEVGVTYNWKVSGINGTTYSYSEVGGSLLELILPAGSYTIECIINGGKYATPAIVSKNIII